MTAVDDLIIPRNPCRIRGGGAERSDERPVLTARQVLDLAEWVGRRPVGNIRGLPDGGYRLRFARNGERRTSPEVYQSRADAERALWKMMAGRPGRLRARPAISRACPAGYVRQPALG